MIEIRPGKINHVAVSVPGSKSYTHRSFIAAALSDGPCRITNALRSDDTDLTVGCLRQLGTKITDHKDGRLVITGCGGRFGSVDQPIFLGNSGTSMRLLTAVAALGQGRIILTGSDRMQQRPIQELLDALSGLGIAARSTAGNGCPPVEVVGSPFAGGRTRVDCRVSSQYLSALLLIAPLAREPVEIEVSRGLVSRPYVDMTIDVMEQFGIQVQRRGYEHFTVATGQRYRARDISVEPDCSQAGYFWAAAAVTGGSVKVYGTRADSRQGDVRLADCFGRMGCEVNAEADGIRVSGRPLKSISVDMADMPDMVPTLAVVAAFAEGTTVIKNVAHLKAKESDRLGAVANELTKMGIAVKRSDSGLTVQGGSPRAADIDTYDDHRMAMSFAPAGLVVPGIRINDEMCVAKSFPNFWEVFGQLYS